MCKIAVIGGGVSGTLTVLQLLKNSPGSLQVVLFERDTDQRFKGLAYSQQLPYQLLNVPAKGMSMFTEEPDHFCKWLESKHLPHGKEDFVPRHLFGRYVRETFETWMENWPGRDQFSVKYAEVTDLSRMAGKYMLKDSTGQKQYFDIVILATGNLQPAHLPRVNPEFFKSRRYIGYPWKSNFLKIVPRDEDIIFIGAGLSMIDLVLSLFETGFKGTMKVISRRGLLSLPHKVTKPFPIKIPVKEDGYTVLELLKLFRNEVRRAEELGFDWRDVMDAFRPHIPPIWQKMRISEKERFTRHLRPFWEIHRHRLPEQSHKKIMDLISSGKLEFYAGRIMTAEDVGDRVKISFRPRGSEDLIYTEGAYVVNCTGPQSHSRRVENALLKQLFENNLVTSDPMQFGLFTTPEGAVINGEDGQPSNIFTIGPLRRGMLWESTAIREIRSQAELLGKHIARLALPVED